MSDEIIEPQPPICPTCNNPKKLSGNGKNRSFRCSPCARAKSKASGQIALSESKKKLKNYDAKTELLAKFGSACNMCGYDTHQSALEFHHINPANKIFSISNKRRVLLTEEVLNEADKCILLCANCHRHVHTTKCDSPEYQFYLLKLKDKAINKPKGWWVRFKRFLFQ
jgi:predicted HNH restriction endonuclease